MYDLSEDVKYIEIFADVVVRNAFNTVKENGRVLVDMENMNECKESC